MLAACIQAKYEDVSHLARYSPLVDTEYRTRLALQILGITSDRNYEPVIDYYLLTGTPSIGGPEVVTRAALPPGMGVTPIGVMKCTNCLFSSIRVVVQIHSGAEHADKPVFLQNVGDRALFTSSDGEPTTLNPLVFEASSD
jgi:hypothetical protein